MPEAFSMNSTLECAIGWRGRDVVAYVCGQAIALGVVGGAAALLLVSATMLVLGVSLLAVITAAGIGFGVSVGAVLIAAAGTLAHAYRVAPATLLRGE
jgi:ABC-type antimicrobial peptide transport system permease subunit